MAGHVCSLRPETWLKSIFLDLCVALLLLFGPTPALGMEFRIYFQPELKQRVVIGEGLIADGDDVRFLSAAKNADRDLKGHVTLVLNSLGGSVEAAFRLIRAMDEVKVYAVVPDDALCASACASIVYVSAERHLVVGTGRLGFHTCYVGRAEHNDPSAICNEFIAQNAVSRGTSHASVDLFTQDFGPTKMAWLDKRLACQIGLCRP